MLDPLSRTNQPTSPETLAALRGVGKHPEEEARDVTRQRMYTIHAAINNLAQVVPVETAAPMPVYYSDQEAA